MPADAFSACALRKVDSNSASLRWLVNEGGDGAQLTSEAASAMAEQREDKDTLRRPVDAATRGCDSTWAAGAVMRWCAG